MNTIITIGRKYGSGGHQIGTEVAKALNIPFYDNELLDKASQDSGLCKAVFENQDEKPTSSFLYSLVMGSYSGAYSGSMMSDMPLNQKIFLSQFDTIKKLAEEGPCVIIGRCADYALELDPRLLSVFITADLDHRIKRISLANNISTVKASNVITKTDKQRANYYNYYTNKKWGAAESYNICLDSGVLGIDGCVETILKAVEIREAGIKQKITEEPFMLGASVESD